VGRLIAGDDDRVGAPAVVVLSYAFARERFGEAADAAGRAVMINDSPFTAIGVTPPGFFGVDPSKTPDFYLPFHADLLIDAKKSLEGKDLNSRYWDEHYYWTEMMGRLRPGVTMAQAQAKLATVFGQWVAATATNEVEKKTFRSFF
jgi:macrolide transport system ATP-binding/permease protein